MKHQTAPQIAPARSYSEVLAPPKRPALKSSPVDTKLIPQHSGPSGIGALTHRRKQNHQYSRIDPPPQEADRGGSRPPATPRRPASKTQPRTSFRIAHRKPARLPEVIRDVQRTAARRASSSLRRGRKIPVEAQKKRNNAGVYVKSLAQGASPSVLYSMETSP